MDAFPVVLSLLMTFFGLATGDITNSSVTYLTVTVVGITKTLSQITTTPIIPLSPIAPIPLSDTVNSTLGALQTSSIVSYTAGICVANSFCDISIKTSPCPIECVQNATTTCALNESMTATGSGSSMTTMSIYRNVTSIMTIYENITVTMTSTETGQSGIMTSSDDLSITGGTTDEPLSSSTAVQEPTTPTSNSTTFSNSTSDEAQTSSILPSIISIEPVLASNTTSVITQDSTTAGNISIVTVRPPVSTALPVPQPNSTWTFATTASTSQETSSISNGALNLSPPRIFGLLSACFALVSPVFAQTTTFNTPTVSIRAAENGTFSPWWSSVLTVTEQPSTVTSVFTTSMFRTTRNVTLLVTVGMPLTFTDTVTWTSYVSTGNRLGTSSNGVLPTPGVPESSSNVSTTATPSSSDANGGNLPWVGIIIAISISVALVVVFYFGLS